LLLLCFALFEILLPLCYKSISILLFPYKNIEIYFIFVGCFYRTFLKSVLAQSFLKGCFATLFSKVFIVSA